MKTPVLLAMAVPAVGFDKAGAPLPHIAVFSFDESTIALGMTGSGSQNVASRPLALPSQDNV